VDRWVFWYSIAVPVLAAEYSNNDANQITSNKVLTYTDNRGNLVSIVSNGMDFLG
jgi:hypothetical protein